MNHFEHNGADNTIDSYDNNHEDGDDNAGDEDHGRGDDDGNNDHDDYANDHGHDDDGNGNNHKDSYDHVEGDINNHGDDDSDDIWSVREGPSMRHILLRETQRNCKLRGGPEDKTNKTLVSIHTRFIPTCQMLPLIFSEIYSWCFTTMWSREKFRRLVSFI